MSALLHVAALTVPGRLDGVSFEVAPGELVCLVGPNGSGKTSLLHALAGIVDAAGEVIVDGVDPRQLGPSQRPAYLTFLPASRDIAWPMLARDVIALGGGGEISPGLELDPLLDRRLDTLSTGERSRVLITRALAPQPRLLLLDEPTANLDPLWQIRLMDLVRAEVKKSGRAALVAIHDLDAAETYGDRVLIMDRGRIAAEGLDDVHTAEIFGVERWDGGWREARPQADRRSSP